MRTKIAFLAGIAGALSFTIYCGGVPGAGGDEVPADAGSSPSCDCPSPERSTFRSGSRLKAQVLKSDDGAMSQTGWYDDQFKAACELVPAAEGSKVCVPALSRVFSLFSDAACTKPAAEAFEGFVPLFLLASDGSIFEASSKIRGRPFYKSDGACKAKSDDMDFYPAGAQAPESMFVRLRPAVE